MSFPPCLRGMPNYAPGKVKMRRITRQLSNIPHGPLHEFLGTTSRWRHWCAR